MFIKIHKSYRDVVAICDNNLVGNIFEEGENQLEVKENFYKGDEVSEQELENLIEKMSCEDATFNIVGKDSVRVALKHGIINQEGIKEIEGIPFTLVLM